MTRPRRAQGRVYQRTDRPTLWLWFRDAAGVRQRVPTPYVPGQEAEARALLATIVERVAQGLAWNPQAGAVTFEEWGRRWNEQRREAGKGEADNELAHLEQHLFPLLGRRRLDELTRPQVTAAVQKLAARVSARTGERLAPATVRKIAGTLGQLLRAAEKQGLIEKSPYDVDREDLPEAEAPAVGEGFSEAEVARLVSDERLPRDRRVLYALEFLTGMRTGEAAARRWRDWDRAKAPLGALVVDTAWSTKQRREKETKTRVRRTIPVHPVLGALLEAWWSDGWAKHVGREPKEGDLIAPLATGEHRPTHTSWRDFRRDLEVLGLPAQRHYETRATFLSLAEGGGADSSMTALITHPSPKKAKDLYRRLRLLWPQLCAAVECIRLEVPASLSITAEHRAKQGERSITETA